MPPFRRWPVLKPVLLVGLLLSGQAAGADDEPNQSGEQNQDLNFRALLRVIVQAGRIVGSQGGVSQAIAVRAHHAPCYMCTLVAAWATRRCLDRPPH